MSISRSLHGALRTAATVGATCLTLPAAAGAATGWTEPVMASAAGHTVLSPNVAAAPDGSATVVWRANDGGDQVLYANTRSASTGEFAATPVQISDDGESASEPNVVADGAGDIIVEWVNASGPAIVRVRVLHAATGLWDDAPTALNDSSHAAGDQSIAVNPDGSVTLAWGAYDDGQVLRMFTRPAGGAWGSARDVPVDSGNVDRPKLAFNAAGDGIAVWRSFPGGPGQVRAARYSAASDTWTVAPQPLATEEGVDQVSAAIDARGNAMAVWYSGDNYVLESHYAALDADNGSWTGPDRIEVNSDSAFLPMVAATDAGYLPDAADKPAGRFVTTYQSFVWDVNPQVAFATSYPQTRTYDPSTKSWGEISYPGGIRRGGAPELRVNARGDMILTMLGTTELSTPQVVTASRPAGADAFIAGRAVAASNVDPYSGGLPHGAIDASGDGYNVFPVTADGHTSAMFSFGDLTGPRLDSVSVPSTGTVDVEQTFSVTASDRWSAAGDPSWDFGDGTVLSGASVSHAFATAGTYTVTITSNDTVGNSTSVTREITISDKPAVRQLPPVVQPPVVQPPVKLPPVIPARLAGKKITITVTVPNCSAKFVAVTKFGTTKYQTKLKLSQSGKVCTATGTIVLKKAPSTRTKLRVAIGRVTKTGTSTIATLTTRRS